MPNRDLKKSFAADMSWANTANWPERTAAARKAFDAKFLAEAGGDPKRAAKFRSAYFKGMQLKSAASRQANRNAKKAAGK